jgi:hypothetical protein
MIKNLQDILNQFSEHGEEAVNGYLFDLIKKGELTKELFLDYLGITQGFVEEWLEEALCEEAEGRLS